MVAVGRWKLPSVVAILRAVSWPPAGAQGVEPSESPTCGLPAVPLDGSGFDQNELRETDPEDCNTMKKVITPSMIDHTCLIVTALDKTQQHYQGVFDFAFQPRDGDPNTWVVESSQARFFFTQVPDAPLAFLRMQHISFRVQRLEEVIERLRCVGVDHFETGVVDFFAHNNYRWCEWRDPDGIRVECVETV